MRPLFFAVLFVFDITLVLGDTVELKSGQKLEGKVTQVADDHITMEVQVSPTIRDEQTIARSDIAKMDVQGPDIEAFTSIKDLQPADTVLKPDYYDEVIAKKIDPFLTNYAYSKFVPDVRAIRKAFEDEKNRMVQSGEVKFDGEWLSKQDYEKNRYQIDAYALWQQMQAALAKEDYTQTLNLYETFKVKYPKAGIFPAVAVQARESADKLNKIVAAYIIKFDADDARREQQLQISPPSEQQQVRDAILREKTAIDAAVENAKKAGAHYIPIYPTNRAALMTLHDELEECLKAIAALPLDAMCHSVQLTKDAQKNMREFNLALAEKNLAAAKKLWPDNGMIPPDEEKLKKRKDELAKSNKEQQEAVKRGSP